MVDGARRRPESDRRDARSHSRGRAPQTAGPKDAPFVTPPNRTPMARRTLYAYVDGSDLDEVADEIETVIEALVASTTWALAPPRIVNQKHERDESYGPEDLTDWDLGLNLDLPDPASEPAGWFEDVEQVARLAGQV